MFDSYAMQTSWMCSESSLEAIDRDGFQELPRMLPRVRLESPLSPAVIEDVRADRFCSVDKIESLGDFLLMQLAWVYDVNYAPTFSRIVERNIISRIAHNLSGDSRDVSDIVDTARRFVLDRLRGG